MKKTLFALSLLAAGLAGAVTVSWAPSGAETKTLGAFDPAQTITLTLSYNISQAPTTTGQNANLFGIGWGTGNMLSDSLIIRNIDGLGGAAAVINATNSGGETSGYTRTALSGAFSTGDHTMTITLNLDGDKSATVVVDSGEPISLTFPTNSLDTTGDLKLQTYDQVWGSISNVAVSYSVPEPTALALLALGVAGVALRRRVS